jgi:hypothetical protein
MTRRTLLQLASGLLVPYEPERVYSFLPAWRLMRRDFAEHHFPGRVFAVAGWVHPDHFVDTQFCFRFHESNRLDIEKSSEAFGIPVVFA